MSCALAAGIIGDGCAEGRGGTRTMYFMALADLDGVTLTSGVVTAVDNATGKRFYKYKFPRETSMAKSTPTNSPANGSLFYTHELSFVLNKMQAASSTELGKLDKNCIVAVVVDENGKAWMLGRQNGLDLSGGESGTGTALGDRNGYARTFTGNEPEDIIEVNVSVLASLETAES
jgi:hypothetical protein